MKKVILSSLILILVISCSNNKKTTTESITESKPDTILVSQEITPAKIEITQVEEKPISELKEGDAFQGGIVTDTHTRIIAAKEDQSTSATWEEAKKLAEDYKSGGFTDWRLPTLRELELMQYHRDRVGNYTTTQYWSSSIEDLVMIKYNQRTEMKLGANVFDFALSRGYSARRTDRIHVRVVRNY